MSDRIVFTATELSRGNELRVYDPLTEVTETLDIVVGAGGLAPRSLQALETGRVLFVGTTAGQGAEPWVTDGTLDGSFRLLDVLPGANSGVDYFGDTVFVPVGGGSAVFIARTTLNTYSLFTTDGTVAGTTQLTVTGSLGSGSLLPPVRLGDGRAMFTTSAFDPGLGFNVSTYFVTDGTQAGTTSFTMLNTGPSQAVALGNGTIAFSASSGGTGSEPWVTDGTAAGTRLLRDINPAGNSNPFGFAALDATRSVFLALGNTGYELWLTDGSTAGTTQIGPGSLAFSDARVDVPALSLGNGKVLFYAALAGQGREPWVTDGTLAGTQVLRDIAPGSASSFPSDFTLLRTGQAIFQAENAANGRELWVTDGTTEGTTLLKDIRPAADGGGINNIRRIADGLIYFTATSVSGGAEPWRTDGTSIGTVMIADLVLGAGSSNPGGYAGISNATTAVPGGGTLTGTSAADLLLGQVGADQLQGLGGNDSLFGAAGNDTLEGAAGADSMAGGAGDDEYLVDNIGDVVTETAAGGTDTARVSVDGWKAGRNIEIIRLEGLGRSVDGSATDEQIFANDGLASTLRGGAGDDSLTGGAGDDMLDGGAGQDTALFFAAQSQARIGLRDGVVMVSGPDGLDQLNEVEALKFGAAASVSLAALQAGGGLDELVLTNIGGIGRYLLPDIYDGPVAGLVYQWLGSALGEVALGTSRNDFFNLLGGDDAVDAGGGSDVIDGGIGSNFLTGGAGLDTFFLDGRGLTNTWSTITDWQVGEQLSLFGWQLGVSQVLWLDSDGAPGYTGVTMHADLDGNGLIDTSVTWAGRARADLPVPLQYDGLLWFV